MHDDARPAAIRAFYFDGRSSRRHDVLLLVSEGMARLTDDAHHPLREAPLEQLRVSERSGVAARRVTFPDGTHLEIQDHAAFDALLRSTGHRDPLAVRLQRNWRTALGAFAGLLVALALGYFYVLPAAASLIARHLPVEVDHVIGVGTLELLDRQVLGPSALPAARQQAIIARFAAMTAPLPDKPGYEIVFRKSTIGPNAFALPSGQIVVTDEIVKLMQDDDALMGVLAHELGHLHQRHLMRRLIQGSVVAAASTVLFGDVSAVLANAPTVVLDMKYSRDIEREADDYAIAMFRQNGLPRKKLAEVFEKLNQHAGNARDPVPYLSSHPDNEERIAHILGAP